MNFDGIFVGALFLNSYEMTQTSAIYFMAITVVSLACSIFAFTFDMCFSPQVDDKDPLNKGNKDSAKD